MASRSSVGTSLIPAGGSSMIASARAAVRGRPPSARRAWRAGPRGAVSAHEAALLEVVDDQRDVRRIGRQALGERAQRVRLVRPGVAARARVPSSDRAPRTPRACGRGRARSPTWRARRGAGDPRASAITPPASRAAVRSALSLGRGGARGQAQRHDPGTERRDQPPGRVTGCRELVAERAVDPRGRDRAHDGDAERQADLAARRGHGCGHAGLARRHARHRDVRDRRVHDAEPQTEDRVAPTRPPDARCAAPSDTSIRLPGQAETAHHERAAHPARADHAAGDRAATIVMTASGSVHRPALNAEKPRASWRYSVLRNRKPPKA